MSCDFNGRILSVSILKKYYLSCILIRKNKIAAGCSIFSFLECVKPPDSYITIVFEERFPKIHCPGIKFND